MSTRKILLLPYFLGGMLLFVLSYSLNGVVVFQANQVWEVLAGWLSGPIFFIVTLFFLLSLAIWKEKRSALWPFWFSEILTLWAVISVQQGLGTINDHYLSLSAALLSSLLPLIYWYRKKWLACGIIFALAIIWSNLYLRIEYFSSIVGGVMLGFMIGYIFYRFAEHGVFEKFHELLATKKETRRQIMHAGLGIIIVFLHYLGLLTLNQLYVILVVGTLLIYLIKKRYRVPYIYRMLAFFERPEHLERFPGRGILFFIIGAIISFQFFPTLIAYSAILILAIGDSVTNVAGRYFGKTHYPFNPKKSLEGTIAGVVFSTVAVSFIIGLWPAMLASSVGMIFEALALKMGKFDIDDNFVIPIVSGLTLLWII